MLESIELGAKDFVIKPFDTNRLLDAIATVLT